MRPLKLLLLAIFLTCHHLPVNTVAAYPSPNFVVTLLPSELRALIVEMSVKVESNATATVRLSVEVETSRPDALLGLVVQTSSPRPVPSVLKMSNIAVGTVGYLASWIEPTRSYVFFLPRLEVSISDIRVHEENPVSVSEFTGRYHGSVWCNVSLGEHIRNAQRFWFEKAEVPPIGVNRDLIVVTERLVFTFQTNCAAQKMEDSYFVDMELWTMQGAAVSFELSTPSEAVIMHSSPNLIRLRPDALFFSGGSMFERSSGGRFYVQYELVPWYLRSPQKDIIVGVILGSIVSTIMTMVLNAIIRRVRPQANTPNQH